MLLPPHEGVGDRLVGVQLPRLGEVGRVDQPVVGVDVAPREQVVHVGRVIVGERILCEQGGAEDEVRIDDPDPAARRRLGRHEQLAVAHASAPMCTSSASPRMLDLRHEVETHRELVNAFSIVVRVRRRIPGLSVRHDPVQLLRPVLVFRERALRIAPAPICGGTQAFSSARTLDGRGPCEIRRHAHRRRSADRAQAVSNSPSSTALQRNEHREKTPARGTPSRGRRERCAPIRRLHCVGPHLHVGAPSPGWLRRARRDRTA